jgi:hypothetical protein
MTMKLNKEIVAVVVAALILVGGVPVAGAADVGELPKIAVGSMGSGDAVIELKPDTYENGKLVVRYFANTHSVSLGNYNLLESTILMVGDETFKPVEADDLNGHHPKGKITFQVDELPEAFTVVIRGIPAVEERVYEWK